MFMMVKYNNFAIFCNMVLLVPIPSSITVLQTLPTWALIFVTWSATFAIVVWTLLTSVVTFAILVSIFPILVWPLVASVLILVSMFSIRVSIWAILSSCREEIMIRVFISIIIEARSCACRNTSCSSLLSLSDLTWPADCACEMLSEAAQTFKANQKSIAIYCKFCSSNWI